MAAEDLPELLCRLRSGRPDAADALARAARPELLRLARLRVSDSSLADDVAQEALLEVLATVDALRNPLALRTWLRLIVRKHADRVTRSRRATLPLDAAARFADGGDGPEALVERRGDIATIRRALATVRDADVLLLRLRYLGEWSDLELADLCGATPGTVRKRLHDARARLRRAVVALAPHPVPLIQEVPAMPDMQRFIGAAVAPDDVPDTDAPDLVAAGQRLETGLKILDAMLPIEAGGTVDLLGPTGLGQLVLVAEIAAHIDGLVVAAGGDRRFAELLDDEVVADRATVIEGEGAPAAAAADRLARSLAASGQRVLLVLDPPTWAARPPVAGVVPGTQGSVTAFRFSPHPRDGDAVPPLETAGTTLVYATELFVVGAHPAIDVLASRSSLVDEERLDPVTVGTARAAREALQHAADVRAFLAQALFVGEPYTSVPGEQVAARDATEGLAACVR